MNLSLIAALFFCNACSMTKYMDAAKQGVTKFHAELNAGHVDQIRESAAPEFRRAATEEQIRGLFTGIRKKLGDAGEWSVIGWNVNVATSGTMVVLRCKTKFAEGDAEESFTWRVEGGAAKLAGYYINSLALVAK